MFRGLYIASTAMNANTTSIDVVSNNLSNANTISYKKDFVTQESFNDILISKMNGSSLKNYTPAKPVLSAENDGVYTLSTSNGYFRVKNNEGMSNNRSVKFRVDSEGYLSTYYSSDKNLGNRVQGSNGDIYVGDQSFSFDDKGQLLIGGQVKDQLLFSPGANVIGTMSSGIRISQVVTNFEQGDLQTTDNPGNFAILGQGFFELNTPMGTRYTRNGSFVVDNQNHLATSEGYTLMGIDGPITVEDDNFSVNKFGEISVNNVIVDRIKVVNPQNVVDLKKVGQSLYQMDAELVEQPFTGDIIQGAVEGSNVASVTEMIDIMQLYRNYEANQKVIASYDKSMEKLLSI